MTPRDVIDKIARGDVFVIALTFPEGLTFAEMAQTLRIARASGRPAAFRRRRARYDVAIHAIDPAARDLEGYLFPDTYPLSRHTDAPAIVRLMVDALRARA